MLHKHEDVSRQVQGAQLKGPLDAPEDGPEDPPAFGDPESPYETIDAKLTARAAILRTNLCHRPWHIGGKVSC